MYHEPRPFFIAEYSPSECRFEYGNPSGHGYIATSLYITLWDLGCREYRISRKTKIMLLVPLIGLIVVLSASRIYNGVHTYNQVLSGLAWGLLTYAALCHVFYYEIWHTVNRFRKTKLIKVLWSPLI